MAGRWRRRTADRRRGRPSVPKSEPTSLSTVGIDTAGTLTAADGALPVDMWRDTPRSLVDALLPRLPVGSPSPTIRRLLRRLLLTAAAARAATVNQGQLLDDRIWMLWRTGDTAGLRDLIGTVPGGEPLSANVAAGYRGAPSSGWRYHRGLSDGGKPDRCRHRPLLAAGPRLFQALAGNADGASLTVALLAERSDHGIQPYKAPHRGAEQRPRQWTEDHRPSPLGLAMMRAAGVQPSSGRSGQRRPADARRHRPHRNLQRAAAPSRGRASRERRAAAGTGHLYPLRALAPREAGGKRAWWWSRRAGLGGHQCADARSRWRHR